MSLDEIESGIRSLVESMDEIDDLVEALTLRVEALEERVGAGTDGKRRRG